MHFVCVVSSFAIPLQIWPHKDYPLIPFGKMVLDRNPTNYFAEVEQMACSPSNMVPGIEPSPDKMLQVCDEYAHERAQVGLQAVCDECAHGEGSGRLPGSVMCVPVGGLR